MHGDAWGAHRIVSHLEHDIIMPAHAHLMRLDELRARAHVRKLREVMLEACGALDGGAVLAVAPPVGQLDVAGGVI